jgi:methionine sulfoxide reductase heme-binding subunit
MIFAETENTLGSLALLTYIATLLPSSLRAVFPRLRPNPSLKILLKHRRNIGIGAWLLATAHVYVVIHQRHLAILNLDFYVQSVSGLLLLLIFWLLALTSNNWSIKKLKSRWKKLHSLTYPAALILLWHIWEKMTEPWTLTTAMSIILLMSTLYMIGVRKYLRL